MTRWQYVSSLGWGMIAGFVIARTVGDMVPHGVVWAKARNLFRRKLWQR